MSKEVGQKKDKGGINPYQKAINVFNQRLFVQDYNGTFLMSSLCRVQAEGLEQGIKPEKLYGQLSILSQQAAMKAAEKGDTSISQEFKDMASRFDAATESFKPKKTPTVKSPASQNTAEKTNEKPQDPIRPATQRATG